MRGAEQVLKKVGRMSWRKAAEEMGNAAWAATERGLAGTGADGFQSERTEGAG